jgi:phage shock protein E
MKNQSSRLILITVVIVALVAVGVLLVSTANTPAPPATSSNAVPPTVVSGLISAEVFTSQFVDADAPHQLIDVRTAEEFASGHLPNAINIPLQELPDRLAEVATDEPVVLYCRSGNRSNQAAQLLAGEGFTQVLDLGGIVAWEAAGLPVVQ